jgi:UTP--glucose-1-phosphate uridylyltransferase
MRARVRKAVFPAAGLGTRFLPATKALPKEMLPLVDRPMIEYVVEEAVESGITEIIVVYRPDKHALKEHFADFGRKVRFRYAIQKKPRGLGDAVLAARRLVGDEPFAVLLADDVISDAPTPCLRQLLEVFEKHREPVLAVERVPRETVGRYGIVKAAALGGRVWEIEDLVEKPSPEQAPSDLAIIGRYVLGPDIFPLLARTKPGARGEVQLTDALRALRGRRPMYGVQFEGRRYDTGDKLGFLQATVELALARPEFADSFRAFLRSLRL